MSIGGSNSSNPFGEHMSTEFRLKQDTAEKAYEVSKEKDPEELKETPKELVPKSTISGAAGNVNEAALQVRLPEFFPNVCGPEQRFTRGVGNDDAPIENLNDGPTQRLEVSPNTNVDDFQCLQVPTNMDVDVPDPHMSLGDQLQIENVARTLSESISHNVTPKSAAQGSRNGIFQQQNRPALSGIPSAYKSVGKCEYSCEHCGALFWYEE
ncbi:hypothetical protein Tco_0393674 [Tanacetum coccineum]